MFTICRHCMGKAALYRLDALYYSLGAILGKTDNKLDAAVMAKALYKLESILGKTDNKLDAIMARPALYYKLGAIFGKIYNKLDAGHLSTETCQEWGVVWGVALSHHIPPDCCSSGRRLHLQSQQDEGTCVHIYGFIRWASIIMT